MNADQRERLTQRRRSLQEATAARERAESIRYRTGILDSAGVSYEVVLDDMKHSAWLWSHFPVTGGLSSPRIHRENVQSFAKGPESDAGDDSVTAWLSSLCSGNGLAGSEVILLTDNALNPALVMRFEAIVVHPSVVSCGFDAWVTCADEGWALEFLADGAGWWWGRALPAPD
jgi:hypothetical protein